MELLFENWRKFQKEILNEVERPTRHVPYGMSGGGIGLFNDQTGKPNFKIDGPFDFEGARIGYVITPTPDGHMEAKSRGMKIPKNPTAVYYSSGTGTPGLTKGGDLVGFGGIVITPQPSGAAKVAARRNVISMNKMEQLLAQGYSPREFQLGSWFMKAPGSRKAINPFGFSPEVLKHLEHGKHTNVQSLKRVEDVNKKLQELGAFKKHWYPEIVRGGYTGLGGATERLRKPSFAGFPVERYMKDFNTQAIKQRLEWGAWNPPDVKKIRAKPWAQMSAKERGYAREWKAVKVEPAKARANARLVDNIPPAVVNAVENAIPKKPGMWKRIASKIPGVGKFALLATVGGTVLLDADKAYASEGVKGALKVYANAGVDFLPIIGDAKGVVELVGMLLPHNRRHEKWKQKMTLDQAEQILAGRGPVGTRGAKISAAPEPETPAAHKARGERGSTTYKGSGLKKHFKENTKLTKSKLQQLIKEEINFVLAENSEVFGD